MFGSLFVNLINWVNIVPRFYEKLREGNFLKKIFHQRRIFCLEKHLHLRNRSGVTGCCKNLVLLSEENVEGILFNQTLLDI